MQPLKYTTTGTDSIKVIEIEKQLKEEEILTRINVGFKSKIIIGYCL